MNRSWPLRRRKRDVARRERDGKEKAKKVSKKKKKRKEEGARLPRQHEPWALSQSCLMRTASNTSLIKVGVAGRRWSRIRFTPLDDARLSPLTWPPFPSGRSCRSIDSCRYCHSRVGLHFFCSIHLIFIS